MDELFPVERAQLGAALREGRSVLLIGEDGSGKTSLARRVLEDLAEQGNPGAIASYSTTRETLLRIAKAFGVPTTCQGIRGAERQLKTEELKEAITSACQPGWVLVCDRAESWAQSLRFYLEDLEARRGLALLLLCLRNPRKDIFLRKTELQMPCPTPWQVRRLMDSYAQQIGHPLTANELADLQQRAGLNLGVAKLVVEQAKVGIIPRKPQHSQTIAIAPYVMSLLGGLAVLRFWGLGTGDRFLYLVGGVSLSLFFVFRGLGRELGKEKRGIGQ